MAESFKKNLVLRNVFASSAIVLIAAALVGLPDFFKSPGPFVIRFGFLKGAINFLGGKTDIFEILIFGLIAGTINFFLAGFVYERERFLSYVFAFASLLVAGLILIAAAFISAVN